MSIKKRRHRSAEEKLRIIEEARQGTATVSEVCRRHGVATGQFYAWEKQAREGALAALRQGKRGRRDKGAMREVEAELQRMRAVVAELSAENLALKKGLWP